MNSSVDWPYVEFDALIWSINRANGSEREYENEKVPVFTELKNVSILYVIGITEGGLSTFTTVTVYSI